MILRSQQPVLRSPTPPVAALARTATTITTTIAAPSPAPLPGTQLLRRFRAPVALLTCAIASRLSPFQHARIDQGRPVATRRPRPSVSS
mmetsp:Transcript_3018/g.7793  ORF Transcript_3018/g.7793 Transcript_3018/m.7793 type:complete len:89 (+) Transcript_3018:1017-1283(+)